MNTLILLIPVFCAAAPPVEKSKTAETMLYVRTAPEGAEIIVDDRPLGTSPGLFKVPPGVRRIVVELDGHEPDGEEVTIKAGQIKRLTFKLRKPPGPVAEKPSNTAGQVLMQFLAALNERDFDKLRPLFLPPDDTPSGKTRRKYLDDVRAEFSDRRRREVRTFVQTVLIKDGPDGESQLVEVEMKAGIPGPDGEGWFKQGQRTLTLRITPTDDVWRIAEVDLVRERTFEAPAAGAAGLTDEAPQRPSVAKPSADPVSEILSRLEAALNEADIDKLKALFLPPDDTPAGKARRKHLEAARADFSNPNRRTKETAVVRLVRMQQRPDGKDKLVEAAIVGQTKMPDGSIEGRQRTLQLRVSPTDAGWRIAQMDLVGEATFDRAPPSPEPPTDEQPQRRTVAKKVTDFPETVDLSTPESACAAYHRASARMDAQAVVDLSWVKIDPAEMERFWERAGPEDLAIYNPAQLEAEILEVLVYRGRLAAVVSRLAFPPGKGRHPYSRRSFGLIDGQWKNLGEDRLPSLDAARAGFHETKDRLWAHFREIEAAMHAAED